MELEPMNGRIVVKPSQSEEKTAGGIYLPDSAEEGLNEGEVIAMADDATDEVVVGDRVVYKGFGGTEVDFEGETYKLLTEDDLLVKYRKMDAIPE